MTEQEKREKVITNVSAIVSDMQEEVDEWKDYSDSELSHGLTCDCDWWYAALQTLKDALALLKAQEPVVRCRDCKYAHMTYDGEVKYCDRISMPDDEGDYGYALYLPGDWFCADGERRDGE